MKVIDDVIARAERRETVTPVQVTRIPSKAANVVVPAYVSTEPARVKQPVYVPSPEPYEPAKSELSYDVADDVARFAEAARAAEGEGHTSATQ